MRIKDQATVAGCIDDFMQMRKLGKSNLEVSALGLGCMGMSWSFSYPVVQDENEMIHLMHKAVAPSQ
jgi:aryl-alcohol dehydrogenase-like predicted oxidoreductase